jgi:hypothetical protein
LHAKLQFSGLSAAMKVMFPTEGQTNITRNEMVGFVNLMRKLSNSIVWYGKWIKYEEGAMLNKKYLLYVCFFMGAMIFTFTFIIIGFVIDGDEGGPPKKGYKKA